MFKLKTQEKINEYTTYTNIGLIYLMNVRVVKKKTRVDQQLVILFSLLFLHSCSAILGQLKIIDSWKATAETLSDNKLLKDIKEGLKDIKAGKISRVRNKVKSV